MNHINIRGELYPFEEKTYKVSKNMSFKVNLVRFIKEDNNTASAVTQRSCKVIILTLLKSLVIKINDKEENFREFDKKLKIKDYLRRIENFELINNISLDLNNKLYYNFVIESGASMDAPDSTNNSNEILIDDHHINIDKLNELCIITPNKTINNFEDIPIFHRNGPEKNSKSEVIIHFSILIDNVNQSIF